MKMLPVFLGQQEDLPATLAEHYTSTSQEVQNKLRENVSLLVEVQTAATAAGFDDQSEGASFLRTRPVSSIQLFGSACIEAS